ncbi:MAG: hypothetical protein EBR54_07920, partial [Flavobacteriia bacterium]|nr:hypothetical protein [Flavobacteriia bacterium]
QRKEINLQLLVEFLLQQPELMELIFLGLLCLVLLTTVFGGEVLLDTTTLLTLVDQVALVGGMVVELHS